ncbi:MAG: nucleotide exchange factor GrpE [Candidatus Atribacteria bacterium]|nr:nucleotide exchange factor GrpE [Candidatus Atribacteria bacterium]
MDGNREQVNDNRGSEIDLIEKYKKMKKNDLINSCLSMEEEMDKKKFQLEELERKLKNIEYIEKTYQDQIIRMQADFENYKKRESKKKQEYIEYANKDLICQLLYVIDNLERASSYTDEQKQDIHSETIKEGIQNTLKDFRKILEKEGLKPIQSVGEKFDPYCHEAVMQVESDQYPEDTVAEEITKGYYLKSKVIRPSIVKVSKGLTKKEKIAENKENQKSENKMI